MEWTVPQGRSLGAVAANRHWPPRDAPSVIEVDWQVSINAAPMIRPTGESRPSWPLEPVGRGPADPVVSTACRDLAAHRAPLATAAKSASAHSQQGPRSARCPARPAKAGWWDIVNRNVSIGSNAMRRVDAGRSRRRDDRTGGGHLAADRADGAQQARWPTSIRERLRDCHAASITDHRSRLRCPHCGYRCGRKTPW